MSSFRFDFFDKDDEEHDDDDNNKEDISVMKKSNVLSGSISNYYVPKEDEETNSIQFERHFLANNIEIFTLNGGNLSMTDHVAKLTDVKPSVYEGGYKIWECSFDAISVIFSSNIITEPKRILDLGCGSGIVGIWLLKYFQNSFVTFHDLNESVLRRATIPNIYKNGGGMDLLSRSSFYFGPWEDGGGFQEENVFDLIVTADTLYNPESHVHLCNLLLRMLKKDGGKALISAKRFYFGIGGGVSSFIHIAQNVANTKIIASFSRWCIKYSRRH